MKQINKNILYMLAASLFVTTYACTDEESTGMSSEEIADSAITFIGSVENSTVITTRESTIMGSDNELYNTEDIHIWQQINDEESKTQVYHVISGHQGRLETTVGKELKWEDANAQHEFYAWTQPHKPNGEDTQITGGVSMNTEDPTTGTVIFGTQAETGLETFIVAHEGPISYHEWGQYVSLHFYHPVAKIKLNSITHIEADGSTNPITSCTITFPNLAKSATFTAIGYTVEEEKYPPVLKITEEPTPKGIEWEWKKGEGVNANDYVLYVPPFNFSSDKSETPYYEEPSFFIITTSSGTYTGSLTQVNDPTELRAGECLTMNLIVRDGAVSGMYSYITGWNTEEIGTIPQHRVPGVYTQEDAEALLIGLLSTPASIPDYLVHVEGEGESQTQTIRFFTHVDWNDIEGVEIPEDGITIPKGYTLDGQGYYLVLPEGVTLYGDIDNLKKEDGTEYTEILEKPEEDNTEDSGDEGNKGGSNTSKDTTTSDTEDGTNP